MTARAAVLAGNLASAAVPAQARGLTLLRRKAATEVSCGLDQCWHRSTLADAAHARRVPAIHYQSPVVTCILFRSGRTRAVEPRTRVLKGRI